MRTRTEGERITLAVSNYDRALFVLIHGAVWMLFAVSLFTAPLWLLLLPASLWLARAHYLYLQDSLLWLLPPSAAPLDDHARAGGSVTSLPPRQYWQLCSRQGEWQLAILEAAFVHPWLTVLDFSHAAGTRRVLIWPDSLKPSQCRRLRLVCVIVTDADYLGKMVGYQHSVGKATANKIPTENRAHADFHTYTK